MEARSGRAELVLDDSFELDAVERIVRDLARGAGPPAAPVAPVGSA